ncbi:MAG: sugar phosphate isomerase/epimerase [Acidobacteriota bacterium]|nr:sugar phosphate isomerase/epimerase [Blastocatellia bacterium]MDW8239001.1 sugar phosphate isomerase/epimerase [Acidobacteriota bacterium]
MQLALNGATTMKADLLTDIRAAHHAGFDLLEIWASKLRDYLKNHSTQQLRRELERHHLRAYSINSIEQITFRSSDAHVALLAECEQLCHIAQEIGCEHIVVVPSPRPAGVSDEEVITESVLVLHDLSDVAARYGVKLAFEFLGFAECSVRTLDASLEVVSRLARPDVGLVLDSFHFYVGGSRLESVARLRPEQLFIFHINGAEDRPRDQLRDAHRLLPDEGILPLKELWSALQAIGYNKMASVEIFRPEYWERDPIELAVAAKRAAERALGLNSHQMEPQ